MSIKTESFLASLYNCLDKINPVHPLTPLRTKAWDHFLELGLPTKKDDAYQYVPLRRLYEKSFLPPERTNFSQEEIQSYLHPECQESWVVFINGYFIPHLSKLPKKVIALSLSDALKSYGPLLQSRWSKTLQEERDPLAILNLAIHSEGLFLYIPPQLKLKTPIQALFLATEDCLAPARIQLFLGAQSEVEWISTTAGNGHHLNLLDLALEQNASFIQTEISSGWHLNFLRTTLKKESRLKHLNLSLGNHFSRHSLEAILQGEGSDVLLQGLSHLKQEGQTHTHIRVEHAAPHARSMQKFKGALEDQSNLSFSGKIYVHPNSEKTEAYQLSQNLILSEGAIANAKPNLEIFNPDVKASHGATVSQIDEEQMFYLRSRGLSCEQARRLLVHGFIQEMIYQIPHPFLRRIYASSL